ncbi:hypothetical protein ANO11243_020730 [Dothideomycetidae sp. 11243]|nr:hypothetical protein ANO11243_020730 [fungal sp. No.11243]
MAPVWDKQDGIHRLLWSMIVTLVLYAFSVGILIILARLLVLGSRRFLAITNEATFKAWIVCSVWLAVGHLFAIYTFYDSHTALISIYFWSVMATCGLTIGLALAGGIVAGSVLVCYRYL